MLSRPLQLARGAGSTHLPEHGEAGASPHIGAQTYGEPLLQPSPKGHNAALEEGVGAGAVDQAAAVFPDELPLRGQEVNAMTQERAGAQQAEAAVDVGVAVGLWEESVHPFQFL